MVTHCPCLDRLSPCRFRTISALGTCDTGQRPGTTVVPAGRAGSGKAPAGAVARRLLLWTCQDSVWRTRKETPYAIAHNRHGAYIRWFAELGLDDIPLVGGKNASLGEMYRALSATGVSVPPGFAITADAYRAFLHEAQLDQTDHRPCSRTWIPTTSPISASAAGRYARP